MLHDVEGEYIEFQFDCLVSIKEIKLQGGVNGLTITNDDDGGTTIEETLSGAISKFEIWYSSGEQWNSIQDTKTNWKPVEDIGVDSIREFTTNVGTAAPFNFDVVSKFSVEDDDFKAFHADRLRLYITEFAGNVLSSKFGIIIDDPNGVVCPQKCKNEIVDIGKIKKQKPICKKKTFIW